MTERRPKPKKDGTPKRSGGRTSTTWAKGTNGAAKVPFEDKPPAPFAADSPTRQSAAVYNADPETQAWRAQRKDDWRKLADDAMKAQAAILADPAHPGHANTAERVLNRVLGTAVQRIGDPEGKPMLGVIAVPVKAAPVDA